MSDHLPVIRSIKRQLDRIGETSELQALSEAKVTLLLDCFCRIDRALAAPNAESLRALLLELVNVSGRIVLPSASDTKISDGGTSTEEAADHSRRNEVQQTAKQLRLKIAAQTTDTAGIDTSNGR